MHSQKSWADRQGIKTGVMGEVIDGITIAERNRATVYEFRKEGIQQLQHYMRTHYTGHKNRVNAILFGVHFGYDEIKYAVFVEDGFLKEVGEDEE